MIRMKNKNLAGKTLNVSTEISSNGVLTIDNEGYVYVEENAISYLKNFGFEITDEVSGAINFVKNKDDYMYYTFFEGDLVEIQELESEIFKTPSAKSIIVEVDVYSLNAGDVKLFYNSSVNPEGFSDYELIMHITEAGTYQAVLDNINLANYFKIKLQNTSDANIKILLQPK